MMSFPLLKNSLGAAAIAVLCASTAGAATLSKQNASDTFDGGGNLAVTVEGGPRDVSALAGGFRVTDGINNFVAWCLDLATNLRLPSEYTPTSDPYSDSIGALTDTQKSNVESLFSTSYASLDLTSDTQSAGFQLALWEVLYETSGAFDLTSGTFTQTRTNANALEANDFANSYLALLGGAGDAYRFTFWESLADDDGKRSQNLVSVAPVPLPASALMLIAGVAGLGFARRKTRA